mgnify:CR=1 FL=1
MQACKLGVHAHSHLILADLASLGRSSHRTHAWAQHRTTLRLRRQSLGHVGARNLEWLSAQHWAPFAFSNEVFGIIERPKSEKVIIVLTYGLIDLLLAHLWKSKQLSIHRSYIVHHRIEFSHRPIWVNSEPALSNIGLLLWLWLTLAFCAVLARPHLLCSQIGLHVFELKLLLLKLEQGCQI